MREAAISQAATTSNEFLFFSFFSKIYSSALHSSIRFVISDFCRRHSRFIFVVIVHRIGYYFLVISIQRNSTPPLISRRTNGERTCVWLWMSVAIHLCICVNAVIVCIVVIHAHTHKRIVADASTFLCVWVLAWSFVCGTNNIVRKEMRQMRDTRQKEASKERGGK